MIPYADENCFAASGEAVLRFQPDGTLAYLSDEEARETLQARYRKAGREQRKHVTGK